MANEATIRERLEASRKELLDLTYRNRLLNFRELSARGIRVIDEVPAQVLNALYVRQKKMLFAPLPEPEDELALPEDSEDLVERFLASHEDAQAKSVDDDGVPRRHRDLELQTPYLEAALERRLLNTYHTARTSIEEHGVNVLFLALGMLHWSDPAHPDREMLAPLVLLPVTLSRSTVQTAFTLVYSDDALGANVSLAEKLRDNFGLEWPLFDDPESAEDFEIDAYFGRCEAIVTHQAGWTLARDDIHLGFFSFHKYVMYRDLDPTRWTTSPGLAGHAVIGALLGDAGFPSCESVIPDEGPLDDLLPPKSLHHVLDIDSSQAKVLAEADTGKSMVVQGPPGTGKSQTIANLIAHAVAQGKTVLFVAEKMAALEVVQRRLDNIRLGRVALELHSNKTNKRAFLQELQKVWEQRLPRDTGSEADLDRLISNMCALNRHAKEVNQPIRDTGRSAYQLFGRILALRSSLAGGPLPELTLNGWMGWADDGFRKARERTKQLEIILQELGDLALHPFRDSGVTSVLPSDLDEIGTESAAAAAAAAALVEALNALQELLKLQRTDLALSEITPLLETIAAMSAWPDLHGIPTENRAWLSEHDGIAHVIGTVRDVQSARSELKDTFTDSAWGDGDVPSITKCLAGFEGSWYRWLNPTYRAAQKKAAALWRIRPPCKLAHRLAQLRALEALQEKTAELLENDEPMGQLFGQSWAREDSDADHLERVAMALHKLHSSTLAEDLRSCLATAASLGTSSSHLQRIAESMWRTLNNYKELISPLLRKLEISHQRNAPDRLWHDYFLRVQQNFLIGWRRTPQDIGPMSRYNGLLATLRDEALSPLAAAAAWSGAQRKLAELLEMRWCEALLKDYLAAHPDLSGFSRGLAERWLDEFRDADVHMCVHNRARVLRAHHGNLPERHGAGQMAVLNREFAKKTRHLPVRRVMETAGLAVQRAKPVFMMSPFSVATYLPRGSMEFDIVIFDEASQVRPVDGFGAIARGRQIIVVGDDKQLPPTAFFDQLQDEDSEAESETRDIESILRQFAAKGAYPEMLRWHYRSRHNSLIEYSNEAFYGNQLVVFPSPDTSRINQGVSFVHVPEGVYQRGARRSRNPLEAERVAQGVMEHARIESQQSLGVVAFSVAQMQEIQDHVEILRRQNPECEPFFADHPDEPFFVKNLENVQGDERDVMYISVGYGRDSSGTVSMNFGPLNNEGGERRLNVLITRAKSSCVVFSNITSEDIDLARTSAAGVRHLKGYLKFAETGSMDVPKASGREPDSPFEAEVAEALRGLGYTIHHQVGSANYFIDLAIVDPTKPGRYQLGIECDGAMYHSSRWARDRDRIRQAVLEGLGWTIHRVWSKSWFDNPDQELRKIQEAVTRSGAADSAPKPPSATPVIVLEDVSQGDSMTDGREPVPYETATLSGLRRINSFDDVKNNQIQDWFLRIVERESPVHKEEVMKRLMDATSVQRLGSRIRESFEQAIAALRRKKHIQGEGHTLWRVGTTASDVRVRDRTQSPEVSNDLEHVPPEEIERAMALVVRHACSINEEDLCRETLRLLGLGALSQARRSRLAAAVERCVRLQWLAKDDDRLVRGGEETSRRRPYCDL